MTTPLPTPHADKLRALQQNSKLPDIDKPRVSEAITKYESWIEEIRQIEGDGDNIVGPLVESLNDYRLKWIDLNFIFDSPENFLHRQRGQLKLDNSVLPRIFALVSQAEIH